LCSISLNVLVSLVCFYHVTAIAQLGATDGEWHSYGGDTGNTKYSPLSQINADNVQRLQVAWAWTSVDEDIRAKNEIIRQRGSFRSYAYEDLRLLRKEQRDDSNAITGILLADGLANYAYPGNEYIDSIKSVIQYNQLEQYDFFN
jgi:hypothetical protein